MLDTAKAHLRQMPPAEIIELLDDTSSLWRRSSTVRPTQVALVVELLSICNNAEAE